MSERWLLVAAKLTVMSGRPVAPEEAERIVLDWLLYRDPQHPHGFRTPGESLLESLLYISGLVPSA